MKDSRSALAETVRHIERLNEAKGGLDAAVDVQSLSFETGIEPETVTALLTGEDAPEDDIKTRVHKRFTALRQSRRRADGEQYSLAEIAASYGSAAQSLTALSHGKGLPGLSAATGIQHFFRVHAGFLTEENVTALNRALQPVLQSLELEATPDERVMAKHGILELAQRTDMLSDDQRDAVLAFVDVLLTREKRGRG